MYDNNVVYYFLKCLLLNNANLFHSSLLLV